MDANNKYGIPEPYCYEINIFDEYSSQDEVDESVWRIFLMATDHIPNKIIEAQILGEPVEDYTEILRYRQLARDEINRLEVSE